MNYSTKTKPPLEPRHYYALVGLSSPAVFDDVVGGYVPHKLSAAEKEFLLQQSPIADDVSWAIRQAELFFDSAHSNGKIYYKNSRWTNRSPLQMLIIRQKLHEVSCTQRK